MGHIRGGRGCWEKWGAGVQMMCAGYMEWVFGSHAYLEIVVDPIKDYINLYHLTIVGIKFHIQLPAVCSSFKSGFVLDAAMGEFREVKWWVYWGVMWCGCGCIGGLCDVGI